MNSDRGLLKDITAAVEQGFDDQVSFTIDLVRFASVRAEEAPVQNYMAEALRTRGYAVDLVRMDPKALAENVGGPRWTKGHSDAPLVSASHVAIKGRSLLLQGRTAAPESSHHIPSADRRT